MSFFLGYFYSMIEPNNMLINKMHLEYAAPPDRGHNVR